jgi:hypothetical protein
VLDFIMDQMRSKAAFTAIHAIEGHHRIPEGGPVPKYVYTVLFVRRLYPSFFTFVMLYILPDLIIEFIPIKR